MDNGLKNADDLLRGIFTHMGNVGQELQLLSLVVEQVYELVAGSRSPVYLRVYFNVRRPHLDRLVGTLYDSKLNWRTVPLT